MKKIDRKFKNEIQLGLFQNGDLKSENEALKSENEALKRENEDLKARTKRDKAHRWYADLCQSVNANNPF